MPIEIKFNRLLIFLGLYLCLSIFYSCTEKEKESERSKTIRLLTNDYYKDWIVVSVFLDDVSQTISGCDSSYILTLKSNFTWDEIYMKIACYQKNNGSWTLNVENNVITIQYIDEISGILHEKIFEIAELSEDYFSYQYAQNNTLKRIRLTAKK